MKLDPHVDLRVIAARTAGFAGADLANLVNEAALLAARRDKTAVDRADFDEAIDRVVAGLEKKRVMNTRERRIVAFHESGHAIVATVLPGLDPVHKISIVQRGFGALGYTMQLPLEDRYLMSKTDLEHRIAVLLGGRTAELIVFNEFSTGAQNDLLRATDIARAMVTEFGMSDAIGPVNHEGSRRGRFIETPFNPERGAYAEETARLIDSEVKRIITTAEADARRVLLEKRDVLDVLSERLLEKEVIEGDELRELLGAAARRRAELSDRRRTSSHKLRGDSMGVRRNVLCGSFVAIFTLGGRRRGLGPVRREHPPQRSGERFSERWECRADHRPCCESPVLPLAGRGGRLLPLFRPDARRELVRAERPVRRVASRAGLDGHRQRHRPDCRAGRR